MRSGAAGGELDYTERDGDGDGADAAGDAPGDEQQDDEIAIAGTWVDSFGITNTITNESWGWTYPGYPDLDFTITQFDNDAGVAIVQDDWATKGERLWGRFEWTFVGDVPYYCQTVDGLMSEELAEDREPIDHDNVQANCNGYAWFEMMPI